MKNNSLYFWQVILVLLIISPTNVSGQDNTPTTHEVTIKNYAFSPSELIIEIGDIVIFKWLDGATGHNVEQVSSSSDTSYDIGFRSGDPESGPMEWVLPSTYVQENGTLYYICAPHVISHSMRGKIIVGEGSTDDASGGNLGLLIAIFAGSGIITVVSIIILNKKSKSS